MAKLHDSMITDLLEVARRTMCEYLGSVDIASICMAVPDLNRFTSHKLDVYTRVNENKLINISAHLRCHARSSLPFEVRRMHQTIL